MSCLMTTQRIPLFVRNLVENWKYSLVNETLRNLPKGKKGICMFYCHVIWSNEIKFN